MGEKAGSNLFNQSETRYLATSNFKINIFAFFFFFSLLEIYIINCSRNNLYNWILDKGLTQEEQECSHSVTYHEEILNSAYRGHSLLKAGQLFKGYIRYSSLVNTTSPDSGLPAFPAAWTVQPIIVCTY